MAVLTYERPVSRRYQRRTKTVVALLLGFGWLGGCQGPSDDSSLALDIVLPPIKAGVKNLVSIVLTNADDHALVVDPPFFGGAEETMREVVVTGPRGTFRWQPTLAGAYFGPGEPGCEDLVILDAGEKDSVAFELSNRTLGEIGEGTRRGLELEPGHRHTIFVRYATGCDDATWQGNLTAERGFIPS